MKKSRILAILLALTMVLTFMPAMAFADDEGSDGQDGTEVTAQTYTPITSLEFTITPPVCGTEVTITEEIAPAALYAEDDTEGTVHSASYNYTQAPLPEISLSTEGCSYYEDDSFWVKEEALEDSETDDYLFQGKFEGGNKYYAVISVYADEGYAFNFTDIEDIKISGGNVVYNSEGDPMIGGDSWRMNIVVEVEAQHVPAAAVRENVTSTSYDEVVYCSKCGKEISRTSYTTAADTCFLATLTAKGKKSLKADWNAVTGADGYDVFMSLCNTKKKKYTPKLVKSVSASTLSYTKSGLKKNKPYKLYVKAFKMVNGSKVYINQTPTVHAYTSKGSSKYTNSKSVSVNKKAVSLAVGGTFKIKAKVKGASSGKSLISKSHASKLRYVSSDSNVATVSKKGKIKAVGTGTCTVYVIAVNGAQKAIKVTVK